MDILPKIVQLEPKILVGMSVEMSIIENKTRELWQQFMPHRHKIENRLNQDFYSLQVYDPDYFKSFNPQKSFTKWAAVEVSKANGLVDGLSPFKLPSGLYAVFNYKGLPGDPAIFQYIYTEWLPNSDYILDNRPHFEVLGSKYKQNSPDSEEEIWIPVREK